MLQSVAGDSPSVHETAYVHPQATVIGDVTLEAETSVWPGAVLRGDEGQIVVREGTNVQDQAVCHERVEIGPETTVGHAAIVHNCRVGKRALVGMNAVVLDGAEVGDGAIVAAGSVVTENTEIPASTMAAGTPASVIREDVSDSDWGLAAERYVDRAETYRRTAESVTDF